MEKCGKCVFNVSFLLKYAGRQVLFVETLDVYVESWAMLFFYMLLLEGLIFI